jgi:hypothetical protein
VVTNECLGLNAAWGSSAARGCGEVWREVCSGRELDAGTTQQNADCIGSQSDSDSNSMKVECRSEDDQ